MISLWTEKNEQGLMAWIDVVKILNYLLINTGLSQKTN